MVKMIALTKTSKENEKIYFGHTNKNKLGRL
jgi:hypothetical protein